MNYLITGTAGFIGFHLARRLLKDGHSVTGIDGITPYYSILMKKQRHDILSKFSDFSYIIGNIEEKSVLNRAVTKQKPDIIIHLAAQVGVRYSLENPAAYIDSNLHGSWNVLELARQVKPKHLLIASTSSIYGANKNTPFVETDPADEPLTLYAATKKSMEVMGHSYAHLYRLPTTALRFFTVYGPWGRPDMALFKFTDAIFNKRSIEIYGEGKMTRDFTYVDDLIEAIIRLCKIVPSESNRVVTPSVIDSLSTQAPFRIVNIGGGHPVELIQFVKTIEKSLGQTARRKMLPMQKGDVPRTYASPDLLKALTGYIPSTTVESGVQEFVKWYRKWKIT